MASNLHLIVVVCLTSGLWTGANADSQSDRVPQTCPPVWTQFEDHCYIYFRGPKDWADAETACIGLGGNLASIPNKAVLDFLNEMILRMQGVNSGTWIGGTDAVKERRRMWTDGSRVRYTRWRRVLPNNRRNEDCTEMNFGGNFWNDIPCHHRRPYVCARKRGPVRPIIRSFPRPRPRHPRPTRPTRPRPTRPRPKRPRPKRPRFPHRG